MKKDLNEMLADIGSVGIGDIVEWITTGYEKKSSDIQILLERYVESLEVENINVRK
jgi:hypothetical protein